MQWHWKRQQAHKEDSCIRPKVRQAHSTGELTHPGVVDAVIRLAQQELQDALRPPQHRDRRPLLQRLLRLEEALQKGGWCEDSLWMRSQGMVPAAS